MRGVGAGVGAGVLGLEAAISPALYLAERSPVFSAARAVRRGGDAGGVGSV